jgi:hypothetical protein
MAHQDRLKQDSGRQQRLHLVLISRHASENGSQARILHQGGEKGSSLARPIREACELVGRRKLQNILFEKFAAAGIGKSFRVCPQRSGEVRRRLLSELRRKRGPKLAERSAILQRAVCPRQVWRREFVYVGPDSEAFCRMNARCRRGGNCRCEDARSKRAAQINRG